MAILIAMLFVFSNIAYAIESHTSSNDVLNESFIEHDYETGTERVFTYADVISSLKEINPNYSNYYAPFDCISGVLNESIINANGTRTIQPGSSFNLIEDYIAPYKYTTMIEVIDNNGVKSYGTGFMVSQYVMLTCAHVVWGDDVYEIKVYPYNNEVITSLDDETYYHPSSWVVTTNYTNAVSANNTELAAHYDWCYLTLSYPIGADTGYYLFSSIADNTSNISVSLTGYPGNNDVIPNFQRYAQYMSQGSLSVINDQRVTHSCSTLSGESGAPVYISGNTVVAIHTGGGIANYGVRITSTLYNLLVNKINEVG